jgi:hypothetical protein
MLTAIAARKEYNGIYMIEKLIEFYIQKADPWNRIFSKMKTWTIIFCFSPLFFLFYPLLLKISNTEYWKFLSLFITIIPIIILAFIFNSRAKKILGIDNNTLLWNSPKNSKVLKEWETKEVEKELKKMNCYDSGKIEIIIKKLEYTIKKEKSNFVLPISLSILLLPIWNNWISLVFSICKESNNFNYLIKFIILSLYILFSLIFIVVLVMDTLKGLYNMIFNRRSENIKCLISLLGDISFTLELEKS